MYCLSLTIVILNVFIKSLIYIDIRSSILIVHCDVPKIEVAAIHLRVVHYLLSLTVVILNEHYSHADWSLSDIGCFTVSRHLEGQFEVFIKLIITIINDGNGYDK